MNVERRLFFNLYLFSNIIAVLLYVYTAVAGGDLRGYVVNSPLLLLFCLFLTQGFMYVFCVYVFNFLSDFKIKNIVILKSYFILDLIILLNNISYAIFSTRYDVGLAGVEISKDVPKYLLYFFIITQPTFLTYIYLAYTGKEKRKLLIINALVILIVSLMKGWLSSLLYLAFILIMFNRNFFLREKKKLIIIGIGAIIVAPIFRFLKSVSSAVNKSESGISYAEAMQAVISYKEITSFFDFVNVYFSSVLERFENTGILYYVIVDDRVKHFLSSYNITPFYAEGWLQERIFNIFVNPKTIDMQLLLAEFLYPNFKWRVNTTLPLWVYVQPENMFLFFAYVILLLGFSIIISKLISEEVVNLTWIAVLIMLFHGWFYSFTLYIQTLLLFLFILIVIRFSRGFR